MNTATAADTTAKDNPENSFRALAASMTDVAEIQARSMRVTNLLRLHDVGQKVYAFRDDWPELCRCAGYALTDTKARELDVENAVIIGGKRVASLSDILAAARVCVEVCMSLEAADDYKRRNLEKARKARAKKRAEAKKQEQPAR